jgi:hypothetical protein
MILRGHRRPAARARAAAGVAVAAALAVAGCGTTPAPVASPPPAPGSLSLATSLSSGPVTWAVVPMGAATAGPEQFWELFARPAAATRWSLETPPDAATNGAIAVAVPGTAAGQSLIAGIRPSQALEFSPVTSTSDGGRTWTPGSPEPGLADVPDALAAPPAGGPLLALGRDGRAELGGAAGGTGLTSTSTLAATPAGRACGLRELTAVAYFPASPAALAGLPLVAGDCTRPGVTGIFARPAGAGGTWQAAGPPVPAALHGSVIRVLRLTRSGDRLTALLLAGTGRAAVLLAAWTGGASWTVSAALRVPAGVTSSSLGADGTIAVTLGGGGAALLPAAGSPASPGTAIAPATAGTSGTASASGTADAAAGAGRAPAWQSLPALPSAPHVTLALPAPGVVQALATNNTVLTVWQLGAAGWTRVQRTTVPIQFGSST